MSLDGYFAHDYSAEEAQADSLDARHRMDVATKLDEAGNPPQMEGELIFAPRIGWRPGFMAAGEILLDYGWALLNIFVCPTGDGRWEWEIFASKESGRGDQIEFIGIGSSSCPPPTGAPQLVDTRGPVASIQAAEDGARAALAMILRHGRRRGYRMALAARFGTRPDAVEAPVADKAGYAALMADVWRVAIEARRAYRVARGFHALGLAKQTLDAAESACAARFAEVAA